MQGANLSTLTAAVDVVKALCLRNPVDMTMYAVEEPQAPPAATALDPLFRV